MNMKRVLAAALVAASLAAVVPDVALAADVYVRIAPPPLRAERHPPARQGYVWAAGHWEWNGHRYVWLPGSWLRARAGYRYLAPRWVERNGRWHYERRGWERDRDPMPKRADRDRDNDGVPNRYDSRPDSPRRR